MTAETIVGRPHRPNAARYRSGWDRANVYITPPYVLEAIRAVFGGTIGLDPCTEADNPTRAERFYALPTNGLAESWDADSIWCNPPYGEARRPWIRRCLEIGQAGRAKVALLMPADTDTELGQAVLNGAESILFPAGRLTFEIPRPNGRLWRASHASMIAGWGVDLRATDLGFVAPGGWRGLVG